MRNNYRVIFKSEMIIKVKVKPNSKEERFERFGECEYLAFLKEAPEKGKANKELIKMIARFFGVPADKVRLKTFSGRKKIVEILE